MDVFVCISIVAKVGTRDEEDMEVDEDVFENYREPLSGFSVILTCP